MGLCTKKGRRDTQPPAGPSLLALRITTAIWHPCQSSEQMIYPSVSFESSLFSPMFAAGERRMFFSSTWEILYESILFVASVPGLFLVKAKSLFPKVFAFLRFVQPPTKHRIYLTIPMSKLALISIVAIAWKWIIFARLCLVFDDNLRHIKEAILASIRAFSLSGSRVKVIREKRLFIEEVLKHGSWIIWF